VAARGALQAPLHLRLRCHVHTTAAGPADNDRCCCCGWQALLLLLLPGAAATACYVVNDSPQPHVPLALGLMNTNSDLRRDSSTMAQAKTCLQACHRCHHNTLLRQLICCSYRQQVGPCAMENASPVDSHSTIRSYDARCISTGAVCMVLLNGCRTPAHHQLSTCCPPLTGGSDCSDCTSTHRRSAQNTASCHGNAPPLIRLQRPC
jgi:hypothetical protein